MASWTRCRKLSWSYAAYQCGYCTPGMLLTAKSLLAENPQPSEDDVRHYLRGNLCRCTGYASIVRAVLAARINGLSDLQNSKLETILRSAQSDTEFTNRGDLCCPNLILLRPRHVARKPWRCWRSTAPDVMPMAGGTNLIPRLRDGAGSRPRTCWMSSRLRPSCGGAAGKRPHGRRRAEPRSPIADASAGRRTAAPGAGGGRLANPLVRNRATLGGNLADASPAADMAPPLLALDAEVELASAGGVRCLPLEDFLTGVSRPCAGPTSCSARALAGRRRSAQCGRGFYKIGLRKSDAISVLSAGRPDLRRAGICLQAAHRARAGGAPAAPRS